MNNIVGGIALVVGVVIVIAGLVWLTGVVIQALWDIVIVPIFGLPSLSWVQALALFGLARILFYSPQFSSSR